MRNFDYLQPRDLDQAGEMLKRDGGAAILAGGTDLLDLLKSEVSAPVRVLNLKAAGEPELRRIAEQDGVLRLGALVTLSELAADATVRRRCPALAEAAAAAATPQLRNAGTLGGNLCQRPRCWYFRDPEFPCLRKGGDECFAVDGRNKFHAVIGGGPCHIVHPSDTATALLALDASILVRREGRTHAVPLARFHVLPEDDVERETQLRPDEVVTGVDVPLTAANARSGFTKFKYRDSWDFAVVAAAAALDVSGGVVRGGRVALGGVAPVPWLDAGATAALRGLDGSEEALDRLAAAVLTDAEPMTENAFKVPLARTLMRRTVARLLG